MARVRQVSLTTPQGGQPGVADALRPQAEESDRMRMARILQAQGQTPQPVYNGAQGGLMLANAALGGLLEQRARSEQRRQQADFAQGANALLSQPGGPLAGLPPEVQRQAIAAFMQNPAGVMSMLQDWAKQRTATPELTTMYDAQGRETRGRFNRATGQFEQVGGAQAPPLMSVNPGATVLDPSAIPRGGAAQSGPPSPPAAGQSPSQPGVVFQGRQPELLDTQQRQELIRRGQIQPDEQRPITRKADGAIEFQNPSPQTTITNNLEKTGREGLIERSLKGLEASQGAMVDANRRMAGYGQMLEMMQGFTPGATADLRLRAAQIAKDLGLPIDANGVASGETMRAIGRRLELAATPRGQGQITENERVLIREQLPTLTTSPEGVRSIIGMLKQLDEYDIQVAGIYREEARKNPNGVPDYLTVQERIASLGAPLTPAQQSLLTPPRQNEPAAQPPAAPTPAQQGAPSGHPMEFDFIPGRGLVPRQAQ